MSYILDTITITMKDVNMQEMIEIDTGGEKGVHVISTYFVPHCKFPPPARGNEAIAIQ